MKFLYGHIKIAYREQREERCLVFRWIIYMINKFIDWEKTKKSTKFTQNMECKIVQEEKVANIKYTECFKTLYICTLTNK